jgi:hypothetical protein
MGILLLASAHPPLVVLCMTCDTSQIFQIDHDDMLEHLEQGDVAETVRVFFEKSRHVQPAKKSTLSLQDVSVHNVAIRTQVRCGSEISVSGRKLEMFHSTVDFRMPVRSTSLLSGGQ